VNTWAHFAVNEARSGDDDGTPPHRPVNPGPQAAINVEV
jgi:hypothetical protein